MRRLMLRLAAFFRSARGDAELARELASHLQLLEDHYIARGMAPAEARDAAHRAFGGQVEQTTLRQRDARTFRWLDDSWLDVKLGARMLVKYPGLSVIGGVAMAVAIAFGAATFAFFYSYMYPTLPLHITAVGFGVARVGPLVGRPILAEDERADAEPILLIGYDVWRSRFGGDRSVIGRQVRLGSSVHTIVGVMPERFAFPMNHSYWVPLGLDAARYGPGEGPAIFIFGRLAPSATVEEAQAELTAIGQRSAAASPKTHAQLRPQVLPYTYPLVDIQDASLWEVSVMQGTVSMVLVIVALNIAILVYARTATRQGEIAVRTALGASRARIVGQLFVEALVLSAMSGAAGVLLASIGLRHMHAIMQTEFGRIPFWLDDSIPAPAMLYVIGITVLAAVLAGVVPALQATRYRVHTALRELSGSTSMHLGRTWTLLRSIFARAATQLALGLVIGLATIAILDSLSEGDLLGGRQMILLPAISLMMLATG